MSLLFAMCGTNLKSEVFFNVCAFAFATSTCVCLQLPRHPEPRLFDQVTNSPRTPSIVMMTFKDLFRKPFQNGKGKYGSILVDGKVPTWADLQFIIMKGDVDMLEQAITRLKNADINLDTIRLQDGRTMLGFAIQMGYFTAAEHLIQSGIGINTPQSQTNETPLHLAIRYFDGGRCTCRSCMPIFRDHFSQCKAFGSQMYARLLKCPDLDVNTD